jgi:hypothetical protein
MAEVKDAKGYFATQPPDKRALLQKLHVLVTKAVPDAKPVIKWGVPVYERNGRRVCALAAFKDNVAITLFADSKKLADPKKKLEGAGATQRMFKVRTAADIDSVSITKWLKVAAAA